METVANFIHGECVTGSGQRIQAIFNPATGEQIRQVVMSTAQETEQAIAAAQLAFPAWARFAPLKRARVMFRFKALLEENMERLARIISEEHGKVFSDAVGELTRGLEVVEFACGIPHLQKGEHSANVGTGVDSHSLMQPLGVCAGITPFNFPAMVPMWMFPIALATGNTFVLKPSEKDPSLALALAKLLKEAGLPDGVFNVVQGDKESVDVLLTDPRVQAVSFVGSTPIAEYMYLTASAHGKRCQALGGAKNHCILMPDADMDMATNAIMGAAYGAAGERCMALPVVVVQEGIADRLVEEIVNQARKLTVGPAYDKSFKLGPVINEEHKKSVIAWIEKGLEEGAVMALDGRDVTVPGYEHGFYLGPTILDHVKPGMSVGDTEIFGPVLCIKRVKTFEEGLEIMNSNPFANGSVIFTQNGHYAREFARHTDGGMVGINVGIPVPVGMFPFSGHKKSFIGDLHCLGKDGFRFYTETKVVTTRWFDDEQSKSTHVTTWDGTI